MTTSHRPPNTGNSAPSFSGYHLRKYAVVAYPNAEAQAKIDVEKKLMAGVYPLAPRPGERPCITIAGFWAKEMMEDTLCRWIRNICRLQPSFRAALNNFSSFPPHTVYLRLQDPQPFLHLSHQFKMLDAFMESNECPPVELTTRPCLPLAEGLPEAAYQQLINEYAHKTFHEVLTVEKLALLKWGETGEAPQRVDTFTLQASRE